MSGWEWTTDTIECRNISFYEELTGDAWTLPRVTDTCRTLVYLPIAIKKKDIKKKLKIKMKKISHNRTNKSQSYKYDIKQFFQAYSSSIQQLPGCEMWVGWSAWPLQRQRSPPGSPHHPQPAPGHQPTSTRNFILFSFFCFQKRGFALFFFLLTCSLCLSFLGFSPLLCFSFCIPLFYFPLFCFPFFASICIASLCFDSLSFFLSLYCFPYFHFPLVCFPMLCGPLFCFDLFCFPMLCFSFLSPLFCFPMPCFSWFGFPMLWFPLFLSPLFCFPMPCFSLFGFLMLGFPMLCFPFLLHLFASLWFASLCFASLCFPLFLTCFPMLYFSLLCFSLLCSSLFKVKLNFIYDFLKQN